MQAVPGTWQSGWSGFQTTNWSMVLAAGQEQPPKAAQKALAAFCQNYWPPLYAFLRHRGYTPSDAQDLTQEFFVHLLEHHILSRADRERGRLRTFLLHALQNFVADWYDRTRAQKRGGEQEILPLHEHLAEAEAAFATTSRFDETACYDHIWVATLVGRAWKQLQDEYRTAGKAQLLKELKPLLLGGTAPAPSPDEVAARLKIPHATLRGILLNMRRCYRDLLRMEVARLVSDPAEIDEEMKYLYHLLTSPVCSLPIAQSPS